jgi:signal transduction histidine kinase
VLAARTQESSGLACQFRATGNVQVPDSEQAHHLYRIAQEAVSNTVRHAHAARLALGLSEADGELLLQVEDDGTGLPENAPGEGMGLRIMAYRAQVMGGTLAIEPGPEGGTRITCRVPRGQGPQTEGTIDER